MTIYTIGYTRKAAEEFFELLDREGLKRVIDVRLSNVSQLAGFTKKNDLKFFLHRLLSIEYIHLPVLAPTKELFDAYKKSDMGWDRFKSSFIDLMTQRRIEEQLDKSIVAGGCLLCSEPTAEHCHRRLVAEYLRDAWGGVDIVHL